MQDKNKSYQHLFTSDLGKSVLDDLQTRFYDVASYTKQDPYHTAYIEGQREVIRYIRAVISKNTGEQ